MAMASRAQCTRDRVIYYGGPGVPGLPVDPDPGVPGLPVDPPLVCPVSPACDTGHLAKCPVSPRPAPGMFAQNWPAVYV